MIATLQVGGHVTAALKMSAVQSEVLREVFRRRLGQKKTKKNQKKNINEQKKFRRSNGLVITKIFGTRKDEFRFGI